MMLAERNHEVWLLDYFGRFLHNDPAQDRIVAVAPEACPDGLPGLIFDISPERGNNPFALVKRVSAPMPLPEIEPEPGTGLAIALRVRDEVGPYADARNFYFSSQPDGRVTFDRDHCAGWECFVPLPATLAATLFPSSGIVLHDSAGGEISGPRADTQLTVLIADRHYPLPAVTGLLEQLSRLAPGEVMTVTLPELGDAPAEEITAMRRGA